MIISSIIRFSLRLPRLPAAVGHAETRVNEGRVLIIKNICSLPKTRHDFDNFEINVDDITVSNKIKLKLSWN